MEGVRISDRPLKITRFVDVKGQAAAVCGDPPQVDGDRDHQEGGQGHGLPGERGAATPGTPGAPRREVPDASMVAGLVTLTGHEASYVDPP